MNKITGKLPNVQTAAGTRNESGAWNAQSFSASRGSVDASRCSLTLGGAR